MSADSRTPDGNGPPPGYRDVSIPFERILTRAAALSLVMLIVSVLPFVALYGLARLVRFDLAPGWPTVIFFFVLVALIVLHELLHAVGWLLAGRLRLREIRFGFSWRALAPYTHVRVPLPARAYRIGTVLPGIVTGVLPGVIALLTGSGVVMLISALMIVSAVGDLLVLWTIREVDPDSLVIDHPSAIGCYVREG